MLIEQGASDRTVYFVESGQLTVHYEDDKNRLRLASVGGVWLPSFLVVALNVAVAVLVAVRRARVPASPLRALPLHPAMPPADYLAAGWRVLDTSTLSLEQTVELLLA